MPIVHEAIVSLYLHKLNELICGLAVTLSTIALTPSSLNIFSSKALLISTYMDYC